MKIIRKLDHLIGWLEKGAAVTLFSILIVLNTVNIFSRNIFQASFENILEISPILVLWLALAGSLIALRENRHIRIDIFLRYTSVRTRFAAHVMSSVFGMMVTGILLAASIEFVINEILVFGPKGMFAIVLPLFFCGSFFRFFIHLVDAAAFPKKTGCGSP